MATTFSFLDEDDDGLAAHHQHNNEGSSDSPFLAPTQIVPVMPDESDQFATQLMGWVEFPPSLKLHFVKLSEVQPILQQQIDPSNGVSQAITCGSDIIPHVYEGGLKIWECCLDLVGFLATSGINFEGLSVLEVGCGAGLPGIYAAMNGSQVDFQDYNIEVLHSVTRPNILVNCPQAAGTSRLIAGDWACINEFLSHQNENGDFQYDLLLTSETIYKEADHTKLYQFMLNRLKPGGVVLLAAKMHYFGVGGGVSSFQALVERDGRFSQEIVYKQDAGIPRCILKMTLMIEGVFAHDSPYQGFDGLQQQQQQFSD